MALKQSASDHIRNPYVGPRTFTTAERHLFFGRTREARDLLALVVSERLVLFYAQSGAGKSSLINTNLIPGLQAEGFEVLPVGRVSGQTGEGVQPDNIFAYNLLLDLHQADQIPATLATMSLSNFLDNLVLHNGTFVYDEQYAYPEDEELKPRVLIIDQFEEILTTHQEQWGHRTGFFKQLNQALQADEQLWVVLTMREDYVAALDPFVDYLPGRLRARYYMQRMDYQAALQAIQRPADLGGRSFTPEAARMLADNLRQIKGHEVLGQFVEPVQLQVVCYQLWENLQHRPAGEITPQDLQEVGNVDDALAQFYEQALAQATAETGQSEAQLRNWFETKLITEAGTRGSVYRGAEETAGISTQIVDLLANRF
jgi:hypothetical protein